jgi:hypothetical protein
MSIKETRKLLESITDREALKAQGYIPINRWGKDHWSMLGYIGVIVSENQGMMNGSKLRVNPNTHVGISRPDHFRVSFDASRWQASWGTRLNGYFENKSDTTLHLPEHDDIDCCFDMEAEGLITMGTTVSLFVQLTEKGREFEEALRRHKQDGHNFADFPNSPLFKALMAKYEYQEKV